MSEFAPSDLPIYIANKDQIIEKITLGTLMPNQYASLPKVLDE
jgi:cytidine deaminase